MVGLSSLLVAVTQSDLRHANNINPSNVALLLQVIVGHIMSLEVSNENWLVWSGKYLIKTQI